MFFVPVVMVLAAIVAGCALSASERQLNVASFDSIWHTVRDEHFDPRLGGVDWEAQRDLHRPRVREASTMQEARAIMREMLGTLGQSHFEVMAAALYDQPSAAHRAPHGDAGLELRWLDGCIVATKVHAGSAAQAAGIRPGWQLQRVAGQSLSDQWRTLSRQAGNDAAWESAAIRSIQRQLRGAIGQSLSVRCRDGHGRRVDVTLQLTARRGRQYVIGHFPPQFVWIESRRLYEDVGYVAFNGFYDPSHLLAAFGEAVISFQDTAGLIIDLRGNGGGITDMAMGMAGWLLEEQGQALGTVYSRHGERRYTITPRPQAYRGAVVVLVDTLTASTAEIFAAGMQDLGRGVVVGMPTAGEAQPSRAIRLPNGDGFQFATANFVSEAGDVLEGVGVEPDIFVRYTRSALLNGRDAMLDAAVAWIRETVTQ